MTRRAILIATLSLSGRARADEAPVTLRGKLSPPPKMLLPDGKLVTLEGDEQTTGVLHDARLRDDEFEVIGNFTSPAAFRILPIHKRALFVHRGGKKLFVTYWCAVCSIRTYTPGTCWCCQEETALDLKETLNT